MSDLSYLSNSAFAVGSISNLILATPKITGIQPQYKYSYGESFIFDFEGENRVELQSDITDHYAEDNNSLNDQIALRPEIITTTGFVAEINNVPPKSLGQVSDYVQRLTVLSAFVPGLTATALRAYNIALQTYQAANKLEELVSQKFNIDDAQSKQAKAYTKFHEFWKDRTLFTVQTPWGKFDNCAIQTLTAVQDEDTRHITNFEVIFKKMRFANEVSETETREKDGRLNIQAQKGSGIDKGLTSTVPSFVDISSLF